MVLMSVKMAVVIVDRTTKGNVCSGTHNLQQRPVKHWKTVYILQLLLTAAILFHKARKGISSMKSTGKLKN